jgi:transcriptional regulator with XRE-family HTH domain
LALDTKLGERLKLRRQEIGMSLRELARRASLTASFLSMVENGNSSVSLDSLHHIAEALGVPLFYFLSDEKPSAPSAHAPSESLENSTITAQDYTPVVRSHFRPKMILPPSGVVYEKLSPDLGRKMEPFCGRLSPGTGNVARRLRDTTEEFVYVLSGSLFIGLDSGEYVLHPGDTIYFAGDKLQRLECASEDEDVVWVSVITPAVF